MSKLKNYIIIKLNNLLRLDYKISVLENDLEMVEKQCRKEISELDKVIRVARRENAKLSDQVDLLTEKEESLHRTIQSILNIGIDADIPNNRGVSDSWGVICYNHGNTPIVKFLDLRRANGRDITNYLKQFDSANFKFDSPYRMMMKEDLLSLWE